MGMSIHGGSYTAAETMQWQQRRQNFDALSQAITSGNLAGANDALTKIKGLLPAGADIKPDSFLGKLSSALQSGDMTAAQQLLASRQNQNHSQAPGADAARAADGTTASSTSDAMTTAATGRRHHHHHGGGESPVLDLSKAIQSGDAGKAQSSMQTIISELQQLATPSDPTGSGANSLAASASSAAQKLLENTDFKALQDAVARGDASGMKDAWTKLIAGATIAPAPPTTQVAA